MIGRTIQPKIGNGCCLYAVSYKKQNYSVWKEKLCSDNVKMTSIMNQNKFRKIEKKLI